MEKVNLVFFGTSYVAADCLEEILKSDLLNVALIVTKHNKTPVYRFAEKNNLNVIYPDKFTDDVLDELKKYDPKLFAVIDYGKILPKKLLDIPELGSFNLHFSLLPKYRGASPVQSAILNNEKVSGVSIFKLTENLDDGDIYAQEEIEIENMRADEVFVKMLDIGAPLYKNTLEKIVFANKGTNHLIYAIKQDSSKATYCQKFTKENGRIDLKNETVNGFLAKMRAFYPWPGIYFEYDKIGLLKVLNAIDKSQILNIGFQIGKLFVNNKKLYLRLKDGVVEILEIQREGKRVMSGEEFGRGVRF